MNNFMQAITEFFTIGADWRGDWKTYLFFGLIAFLLAIAAMCFMVFVKMTSPSAKRFAIEKAKELQGWSEDAENARRLEAELIAMKKGEVDNKKGILPKMDLLFRQAGIFNKYPSLSTELCLILFAIFVTVVTLFMALVTRNVIIVIVTLVAAIFIPYLIVGAIAKHNMSKVQQMLIIFCDTAINISETATNLMDILLQCSYLMDDPLKSALVNAYNEATAGDDSQRELALYHLRQNVPEEQFGAIIQDLEMASRYSANYEQVIKDRKGIVESHIASESKKKQLLSGGRLNIAIMVFVCFLCINALQDLVEGGIWNLLLTTPVGIIILIITAGIILYALKTCITPPSL